MKRASSRAARAMATAMRVVGDEEGKGGKVMAMATGLQVSGLQWRQRGQW